MAVFGTRPEAIKMFPVVEALKASEEISVLVCVTAQHRGLLDQVLEIAGIVPDFDLDLMEPDQTLDSLASRLILSLGRVLDEHRPDRVLVHGDTLTTMMATMAAYFRKIPVGHVEAGLRSGNIYHPWPEEVNRRVVGCIADMHFAPTEGAAISLKRELGDAARVYVTGNTVIDALISTSLKVSRNAGLASDVEILAKRFSGKRIIAVTTHRRENFGDGMINIANAIAEIATRPDVAIVFPVHPNPNVKPLMERILGPLTNVAMIDPLDYTSFVKLLTICDLVLTDSGGVQEEAPSLGKPVLVMRKTTERPEGIEAGTAILVGSEKAAIVSAVYRLLDDKKAYSAMASAHNPYGDGTAAEKITTVLLTEARRRAASN